MAQSNIKFIIFSFVSCFGGKKSKICPQGHFHFGKEALEENPFSCLFQLLVACPHCLVCTHSSIFKARSIFLQIFINEYESYFCRREWVKGLQSHAWDRAICIIFFGLGLPMYYSSLSALKINRSPASLPPHFVAFMTSWRLNSSEHIQELNNNRRDRFLA